MGTVLVIKSVMDVCQGDNVLSFILYEEVLGIVSPGVKCARWLATPKDEASMIGSQ